MDIRLVSSGQIPAPVTARAEIERNVALARANIGGTSGSVANRVHAGQRVVTPAAKVVRAEERDSREHPADPPRDESSRGDVLDAYA